jgi:hypothetical protein
MTPVNQTRRPRSALGRNRRPGSTAAEARRTRIRVGSDSVVSAYIREIAESEGPRAPAREPHRPLTTGVEEPATAR